MPPLIHHYHPVTKALLSVSDARPDPQDADNWLIPAHSTTVLAPPAGANEAEVFDEAANTWSNQADYRGHKYWLPSGEAIEIWEIGTTPPADALDAPPPRPLDDLKAEAHQQIDTAAGVARGRFVSPGQMIEQEYQLAERQAQSYIDSGGPVPDLVQHWADLTSQTIDAAATDITTKAGQLYDALALIRIARLTAKKSITDTVDHAAVDAALATALTTLEAITPAITGS